MIAARITAERAALGLPGISAQDILEANGLSEESSRTLRPGQDLVIPELTRHAEEVMTPAQLDEQRQGARRTPDGNIRVAAGESLAAWLARVHRRNPQLGGDGRIYEGQLLDLPPGQNRVGFGSGPGGAATREVVPNAQGVPAGIGVRAGPGARRAAVRVDPILLR